MVHGTDQGATGMHDLFLLTLVLLDLSFFENTVDPDQLAPDEAI